MGLAAHGAAPKPPTGFAGLTSRFDLDKPVLAMVNGAALGGGLELALACDLVVAAEHATFGLPEPRVGLAALGGGLQRIARQLPLKLAMELVLTGRTIDAAEAYRLGLVNRVVPAAELKTATWALIDEVLACAPPAVRASKAILMASLDEPSLESSIRAEHPAAPRMYSSLDAIEGPRAFAEKRRPRWQGR
jgi:crotonobetainyl-CoA hydratase